MAGYLPFDDSNLIYLYRKIHKAEVRFPPWFSSEACELISQILNPNPTLRATIPQILQNSWFKKDFSPVNLEEESDVSPDDVNAVFNESKGHLGLETDNTRLPRPAHLNAFDLIALSNGLSLSKLFGEKQDIKKEVHFTSKYPASEIITKIEDTAKPLGFNVLRQNYKMKLRGSEVGRKGHLSIDVEVFEVAPSLSVVEVRKACGDTLEYHKFYQNFSRGLKDIVWKNGLG
eukprot:c17452_g1_i1 orf=697-1389(+)